MKATWTVECHVQASDANFADVFSKSFTEEATARRMFERTKTTVDYPNGPIIAARLWNNGVCVETTDEAFWTILRA